MGQLTKQISWPITSAWLTLAITIVVLIWTGGQRWSDVDNRITNLYESCVMSTAFEVRLGRIDTKLNGVEFWIADISKTLEEVNRQQHTSMEWVAATRVRLEQLEANRTR